MGHWIENRRAAHRGQDQRQDVPVYEVKLTPSEIDAIVSRVAELLRSAPAARPARSMPRLMTAAEIARWCGVERSWVYAHAEQLGARRIGTGERPRLRFDPAEVSERIAALNGSQTSSGRGSTAIASDSRNRSLPRRRRGIVVGQNKTAGRRSNAPGPAPKV
jgi:hypothetical protein